MTSSAASSIFTTQGPLKSLPAAQRTATFLCWVRILPSARRSRLGLKLINGSSAKSRGVYGCRNAGIVRREAGSFRLHSTERCQPSPSRPFCAKVWNRSWRKMTLSSSMWTRIWWIPPRSSRRISCWPEAYLLRWRYRRSTQRRISTVRIWPMVQIRTVEILL